MSNALALCRVVRNGGLRSALTCSRAGVLGDALLARGITAPMATATSPRGFSASGFALDKTQTNLASMIEKELNTEKGNYESPEELKSGPPTGFTLVQTEGCSEIVLTRDFESEKISVSFICDDEEQHDMDSNFDEGGEEEGEEEFPKETVFFTVDISKPNTSTLTFDCVTNGSMIEVTGVSLESETDTSAYTGPPDYSVLDDHLHQCFDEYLEARGINEELAGYIMDVTSDKEQREYMRWLQNMHSFMKA
eukprot:CAMPEP_0114263150 /NCGR_PEP_ID=MMETSP0058-20121206/22302_1 /TAXON_ID=36894 /ORGANISM="Pyramimonas parkeae, CCMP726" /LENGTH=250 /DNA_ID=CAMNT_0001379303 /DNA_START=63 /DNA_END=815 /DNA_ORIENTATION=-